MEARRGGETDQQNVIMHKAYFSVLPFLTCLSTCFCRSLPCLTALLAYLLFFTLLYVISTLGNWLNFCFVYFAAKLEKFEVPQKVTLVKETWTPETELVTAALKLKRKNITSFYQSELQAMYS